MTLGVWIFLGFMGLLLLAIYASIRNDRDRCPKCKSFNILYRYEIREGICEDCCEAWAGGTGKQVAEQREADRRWIAAHDRKKILQSLDEE